MSLEDELQMLSVIGDRSLGVRELAKTMRTRTQTVVSLIKKMADMGLVEANEKRMGNRGRPRKMVSMTVLGGDYLKAFNEMKKKSLRGNMNDLIKAKRDAEYVNRLIARGKDPFQAFLELNSVVRIIRDAE